MRTIVINPLPSPSSFHFRIFPTPRIVSSRSIPHFTIPRINYPENHLIATDLCDSSEGRRNFYVARNENSKFHPYREISSRENTPSQYDTVSWLAIRGFQNPRSIASETSAARNFVEETFSQSTNQPTSQPASQQVTQFLVHAFSCFSDEVRPVSRRIP